MSRISKENSLGSLYLEIQLETFNQEHKDKIKQAVEAAGFVIED